jgi:hypothetical protein
MRNARMTVLMTEAEKADLEAVSSRMGVSSFIKEMRSHVSACIPKLKLDN